MNDSVKEVDVRNLTVKFKEFTAVDDISFSVGRGEIFGFLGANGAGKTTTIRVLCGLLAPTSGEVEVAGERLNGRDIRIKSKVGYMSQRFTLYDDLTVGENLDFAASLRKLDKNYYAGRKDKLLKLIGFGVPLGTLVRNLPAGIMQQIALAAAVLHDPEIVFLDEPTAGVTPAFRAKFWDLIRSLSREGKTVFVTTHYMDEADHCDRIALMRTGRIIALDTPSNLKRTTFRMPIFEVDPALNSSHEWLSKARDHESVESIESYGNKYHVVVKDARSWKDYAQQNLKGYGIKEIEPSLEDVFIRLVEGKDR